MFFLENSNRKNGILNTEEVTEKVKTKKIIFLNWNEEMRCLVSPLTWGGYKFAECVEWTVE